MCRIGVVVPRMSSTLGWCAGAASGSNLSRTKGEALVSESWHFVAFVGVDSDAFGISRLNFNLNSLIHGFILIHTITE